MTYLDIFLGASALIILGHFGTIVFNYRTKLYATDVGTPGYQDSAYTHVSVSRAKVSFAHTARETLGDLRTIMEGNPTWGFLWIIPLGIVGLFHLLMCLLPRKTFDKLMWD